MMAGKDFDGALHGFKLVDEALSIRFYQNLYEWCLRKDITLPFALSTLLSALDMAFDAKQD